MFGRKTSLVALAAGILLNAGAAAFPQFVPLFDGISQVLVNLGILTVAAISDSPLKK